MPVGQRDRLAAHAARHFRNAITEPVKVTAPDRHAERHFDQALAVDDLGATSNAAGA